MEKKEKLMIMFVVLALILIVVSITLLNSPLEGEEACLTAGYRWDPVQEKCIKYGKQIFCSQVYKEECHEVYQPVCGWFDTEKIRCFGYPCAGNFNNDCFACSNDNVLFYTQGVCPT